VPAQAQNQLTQLDPRKLEFLCVIEAKVGGLLGMPKAQFDGFLITQNSKSLFAALRTKLISIGDALDRLVSCIALALMREYSINKVTKETAKLP